MKSLCGYIKNNLEKDAVIFINTNDNNSTHAPLSFTINALDIEQRLLTMHSHLTNQHLEWVDRMNISESFESKGLQLFLKSIKHYPISHILTTNNHQDKFKNFNPIWKNNEFSIFKITDLNKYYGSE